MVAWGFFYSLNIKGQRRGPMVPASAGPPGWTIVKLLDSLFILSHSVHLINVTNSEEKKEVKNPLNDNHRKDELRHLASTRASK
jgi:hypothetical protein